MMSAHAMREYQQARENYARLSAPLLRARGEIYATMRMGWQIEPSGEMTRIEYLTELEAEYLRLIDETLKITMIACFRSVSACPT